MFIFGHGQFSHELIVQCVVLCHLPSSETEVFINIIADLCVVLYHERTAAFSEWSNILYCLPLLINRTLSLSSLFFGLLFMPECEFSLTQSKQGGHAFSETILETPLVEAAMVQEEMHLCNWSVVVTAEREMAGPLNSQ